MEDGDLYYTSYEVPDDDAVLWRYMDLAKFVSLLKDKALYMTRADMFEDPFEEKGVKNALIFHTIIETCKQASIMVKDYLTYVLSELNRGNKDYASLTPSKVVLK